MSTFQAFDPQSQLLGGSALAFIKNILHDDISEILAKRGLEKIDPQQWYSLQDMLDVFNDIASQGVNRSPIFVSVGMGAADLGFAALSPEQQAMSLEQFFNGYEAWYRSRHRGDVGFARGEKVSDNHFKVSMKSPYPDDVFYGVFYSYAKHLRPKDKHFTVSYDLEQPRRDEGGEVTIYHIELTDQA